jgi:hypothetical protein
MLDALVAGTIDAVALAYLALGNRGKKLPALRRPSRAASSHWHALSIGAILAHLDFLDEQIGRLSDVIEDQIGASNPDAATPHRRAPGRASCAERFRPKGAGARQFCPALRLRRPPVVCGILAAGVWRSTTVRECVG